MVSHSNDLNFENRMVALFTALRHQSLYSAMSGLWLDLLRQPLNLAAHTDGAAALPPEARESIERVARRNLMAAARIAELLSDEVRVNQARAELDPRDEDETADEFTQRCLEQSDSADALGAAEVLDDIAQTAAAEIHGWVDGGTDRSALPRLAAVVREAIGNDALLGRYIDPETGECYELIDEPGTDEMVDESDPNTD